MTRYFIALSAVAVLAGAAPARDLVIKWHGQSFFEIHSTKGTTIAIDPHNLDAYGRRAVKADAVLITHYHLDHDSLVPITNARSTKVLYGLKNKEGSRGNRRFDQFANLDEKVKDFHIKSIGSYHDNVDGMERGKNTIFIIDVDGLRIVHLGDLGHQLTKSQLRQIGKVDVLMIPVGGVYTLNGSEAKRVVAQIKPRRYIIPMHYATKVYDPLLGPDEFLDEQDEKLIDKSPHNELLIDPTSVPRKKPHIALLSYEPKGAPRDK
jgi:L-ascorbate metabolism protein UlaG (beta-lactamase superfamily)